MIDFDALSLGFRDRYLDNDELAAQLRAWTDALPEVAHLTSIGSSEEGRPLLLLTIGRDPERVRPAVWIDGNIHASELAGSSVALAIAEDLLRAHAGAPLADLPERIRRLVLDDVLVYVLPRMCPDGVDRVLRLHHFVRSNQRDHRLGDHGPRWLNDDVDGDGKARLIRIRDEAGDFVESRATPGLMLPREVADEGPFYRIYPEGRVDRWDGFTVPRPHYLSDSETDMNRNFPSRWRPEPEQVGAGAYPTSEPESRAVVAFVSNRPYIFAWMALHTFGGVIIRPLGDKPDTKLHPHDRAVFKALEAWSDATIGYPTVSGFSEFTYEPEKPLHGEATNFAFDERGAIGFVVELWDFFKQVGFEVKRPFVKNYEEHTTRADIERMAAWDREHNEGRIVGAWRPFEHPQLGPVEVGGYEPLVGVRNPPPELLPELCAKMARFLFRVAAAAPRLVVRQPTIEPIGDGLSRVVAVVENLGFLPTYVLGSALSRPFCDPVRATLELGAGLELVSGNASMQVGHLAGWGGNDTSTTPMMARSTQEWPRARLEWVVRGAGELGVVARCARVGEASSAARVR
jgi:hypothetical protein